jgi:hypothetical protein
MGKDHVSPSSESYIQCLTISNRANNEGETPRETNKQKAERERKEKNKLAAEAKNTGKKGANKKNKGSRGSNEPRLWEERGRQRTELSSSHSLRLYIVRWQ